MPLLHSRAIGFLHVQRFAQIHPSDLNFSELASSLSVDFRNPKFAEFIYFKPAKTVNIAKDEAKWREGVWLGFIDNTNEHIIGTKHGAIKCRAIRRNDITEQFNALEIEK